MKILLTLFVLLFSFSINAKTIFCYGLYTSLEFKFVESHKSAEWIDYYEINDIEKTVEHLKSFSIWNNPPKKINDFYYEDKNGYEIFEGEGTYDNYIFFDDNEILVYREGYNEYQKHAFRSYLYFDRISGINIALEVKIDENGKEYTTDEDEKITERINYDTFLSYEDNEFYSNVGSYKSQCEIGNVF